MTITKRAIGLGFGDNEPYLDGIDGKDNTVLLRQVPDPLFKNPKDLGYDVLALTNEDSYDGAKIFRIKGGDLFIAFQNAHSKDTNFRKDIILENLIPAAKDMDVRFYLTALEKQQRKDRLYDMLCDEFSMHPTNR